MQESQFGSPPEYPGTAGSAGAPPLASQDDPDDRPPTPSIPAPRLVRREPRPDRTDQTMVLPAFITRSTSPMQPDPVGAGSDPESGASITVDEEPPNSVRRHAEEATLPPSERGMLIFVASLLALGTFAVVAMFGLGAITHGSRPRAAPAPVASTSTSPSPADPSPSPVASLSPTPSTSAPPSHGASATSSAGQTYVGKPDPFSYCAHPVFTSTWACKHDATSTPFTPAQVCHSQFGAGTFVMYSKLSDPSTWKCYRP